MQSLYSKYVASDLGIFVIRCDKRLCVMLKEASRKDRNMKMKYNLFLNSSMMTVLSGSSSAYFRNFWGYMSWSNFLLHAVESTAQAEIKTMNQ